MFVWCAMIFPLSRVGAREDLSGRIGADNMSVDRTSSSYSAFTEHQ